MEVMGPNDAAGVVFAWGGAVRGLGSFGLDSFGLGGRQGFGSGVDQLRILGPARAASAPGWDQSCDRAHSRSGTHSVDLQL